MKKLRLQTLTGASYLYELERKHRYLGILSQELLARQNQDYEGSGGVSRNNRQSGLLPAFSNTKDGRVEISRFADGRPAPMHLLEGVPDEWVQQRDSQGHVLKLKSGIVAGFVRDRRFYNREEAAKAIAH